MRFSTIFCAAACTGVALGQANNRQGGGKNNNAGGNNNNNNAGGADASLTLTANLVNTGSQKDGGAGGVAAAGQALSKTSNNNFINNCAGKTLTNGLQVEAGSCNGIPMGDIPAKANMISGVIINPATGGTIAADTTFDITVQIQNLVAGSFTNAQSTYYSAPQQLQGGKIIGHTHVTVQNMGNSLNPKQPLNPTTFAFFKGINDAGNGNGLLSATVTGGLPAGNYRVCTMTAAMNHQPVLMPVAQRGAQDDCTKFVVGGAGNNNNNGNNNNAGGNAGKAGGGAGANAGKAGGNAGANAGKNGGGAGANAGKAGGNAGANGVKAVNNAAATTTTTKAAAAATTTTAAANAAGKGKGGRGGAGRFGQGRQRRTFVQ